MSDENKIIVPVEGDTKPFDDAIAKSAKKSEQALGSAFKKPIEDGLDPSKAGNLAEGIVNKVGSVFGGGQLAAFISNPITMAFAAAGTAGAKLVSDIFEGEAVKKIEKNFEGVTQSFNVAGEKMLNAFMENTGGLVDNTDAMKSLTEKTVQFNGQVERLPELYSVARKAASVFGRDSMEVFDDLSRAAQTGNAKMVKYLFPKLDLEKEISKYAAANRILVADISEAQRQQIAMNALIEIGSKRFGGASIAANTLTEEWKKLTNAYQNMREEQQKSASEGFFSGVLKGAVIDAREMIEAFNKPQLMTAPKTIADNVYNLQLATQKLNDVEAEYNNAGADRSLAAVRRYTEEKRQLQETIKEAQKYLDISKKQASAVGEINPLFKLNFQQQPIVPTTPQVFKFPTEAEKEAAKQKQIADDNYLASQKAFNDSYNKMADDAQSALVQKQFEKNKLRETADALYNINTEQMQRDHNDKVNAIGKQMLDKGLIDQESFQNKSYQSTQIYQQAKSTLDDEFYYKQESARIAHMERMKQVQQQEYADRMAGTQGFVNMFTGMMDMITLSAQEAANNFSQSMKQIANSAMQGLGGGVANGFKKMTLAMREGKNGLQAFGEAFLATIGDTMVQMGSSFIAMAVPMMIIGDPRGGPLMGAGAGLIAAGVLLSASVGGGSTQGGATSGGAASPQSFESGGTPATQNQQMASGGTGVNVVVQGNVYDMEATGKQIADVVSQAFQTQGVRVYS